MGSAPAVPGLFVARAGRGGTAGVALPAALSPCSHRSGIGTTSGAVSRSTPRCPARIWAPGPRSTRSSPVTATNGTTPSPVAAPASPTRPAVPMMPRIERGFCCIPPRAVHAPLLAHSSESSSAASGTHSSGAASTESNRNWRTPRLPNSRPGREPTTVPRIGVNAGMTMQPPASSGPIARTSNTVPSRSWPPVTVRENRTGMRVPGANTPERSCG